VFLPLLIASSAGVLINTGSVSGFWPTAGAGQPITAYCTANFAIKGFSEALAEDLRSNAPQVRVVLVMPGMVNTDIAVTSRRVLGLPDYEQLSDAELLEFLPEEGRAILVKNSRAKDLPRRRRRPSSWTGCDPVHGGSSSATKPRCSTSRSARILRPPSTTRSTRKCTVP
jgi:NAD(P)-dependent dehydrogenase (short-subunit alcohol dehydrogenase family)